MFNFLKKSFGRKSGPGIFGASSSSSSIRVTDESALKYLTVLSCIRVLSESVGMMPVNVFQYTKDGGQLVDRQNPLYRVLAVAPNSFQTATEFWEMAVAHLAWRGNFYAFKVTGGGGQLLELIPLKPDSVQVKQSADYSLEYKVTTEDGAELTYSKDEIFQIKRLSLDGITGLSPISYAKEAIGLGLATQTYGSKLFQNGARPGGVLSTEGVLRDDARKRIAESWDECYRGVDNSHKVAILEAGLKFSPISMSSGDIQFLETRKYQRTEICGWFRVPPHMIGDLERSTFTNIEHQSLEFVTQTLGPYLAAIESRIVSDLLTEKEQAQYCAKFDVTALLRGDMAGRSAYYTTLANIGALSPNEIRVREGMNPRPGGDVFLTPLNMTQESA